tara:strand:- start:366 stop:494 length:129 start_codon:yes stop_codon:yes gene_type:complete
MTHDTQMHLLLLAELVFVYEPMTLKRLSGRLLVASTTLASQP